MTAMTAARIASLNVSDGGVPKRPVERAFVGRAGMAGDRQRDREHHGGPDRALCLWSLERIDELRVEGHPVHAGSTGENVTVAGVDWDGVVPGLHLRLGPVLVEVTAYTTPCRTIARSFVDGRFARISHQRHPGWSRVYARVLIEGEIMVGDEVEWLAAGAD
jgi:MOSC domain-containing protein YiiM